MNAHSRAVLVPLARSQLPQTTISVPGPGPVEPGTLDDPTSDSPVPPVPPTKSDGSHSPPRRPQNLIDDDEGEVNDDDEPKGGGNSDPYSNLDGAFGNYLADEPRPMDGRRNGDEDDLLF